MLDIESYVVNVIWLSCRLQCALKHMNDYLQVASKVGVVIPSSCNSGSCGTCEVSSLLFILHSMPQADSLMMPAKLHFVLSWSTHAFSCHTSVFRLPSQMEVRKWDEAGLEGGTSIARTCIAGGFPQH